MYLPAAFLGVLSAIRTQNALPQREPGYVKYLKYLMWLILFVVLLWSRIPLTDESFAYNHRNMYWTFYSIAAAVFCLLITRIAIGYVGQTLAFLGRHSGNIFLVHMLFVYNIPQVIYATKTIFFSWLTLLLLSLLASLLIEKIKKLIHYNQVIQWMKSGMKRKNLMVE